MSSTNFRTSSEHSVGRTTKVDMNSVYSLNPEFKDNHIVDVIMMIMDDDGPKPMRNLRPTQKHRNGAEQFYLEHHEEYEARGRQGDKMTRVTQHNNAFPKMYDELNKRKSMTRVIAIDPKLMPQKLSNETKVQSAIKSKRFKVAKKSKPRLKHRRSTIQPTHKDTRSAHKVMKSKCRSSRNSFSSPYKMYQQSNKSAQHTKYSKNMTTSEDSLNVISEPSDKNMDTKIVTRSLTDLYDIEHFDEINGTYPLPVENKKESSKELNRNESESKHQIDTRNPDTSNPSVSSYNSYMSMDHEPMVAP